LIQKIQNDDDGSGVNKRGGGQEEVRRLSLSLGKRREHGL